MITATKQPVSLAQRGRIVWVLSSAQLGQVQGPGPEKGTALVQLSLSKDIAVIPLRQLRNWVEPINYQWFELQVPFDQVEQLEDLSTLALPGEVATEMFQKRYGGMVPLAQ